MHEPILYIHQEGINPTHWLDYSNHFSNYCINSIGFDNIICKRGPNTEPYGTPCGQEWKKIKIIVLYRHLLLRLFVNYATECSTISEWSSLNFKTSWSSVTNSFVINHQINKQRCTRLSLVTCINNFIYHIYCSCNGTVNFLIPDYVIGMLKLIYCLFTRAFKGLALVC